MERVQDPTLIAHVQCPTQPDKAKYKALAREWRGLIRSRGKTKKHATERWKEVRWVLRKTRYNLTDATVETALGKLGLSRRSRNKYLSSIKNFTKWLARPSARVLQFDPLSELKATNTKLDRRVLRTSFVPVLGRLLATAEASTRLFRDIGGQDRAELYHAAACTGLREGTLAVLDVGQFYFDATPAYVKVRADQLKDQDDLVVPIQADSAARLRMYLANKHPQMRAFRCPPHDYDFARMLQKDMAEAGIPYCRRVTLKDGAEQMADKLDFHSFRHTFGSWCASAKVELTMTQKWMGHSDPALTANVYTHVVPADQAAAVAKMPPLPGVKRAS